MFLHMDYSSYGQVHFIYREVHCIDRQAFKFFWQKIPGRAIRYLDLWKTGVVEVVLDEGQYSEVE